MTRTRHLGWLFIAGIALAACGGASSPTDGGSSGGSGGGTGDLPDSGLHQDAGADGGTADAGVADAGCGVYFSEQVRLPVTGMQPTDLALADVDDDGYLDLIVVGDSTTSNVRIFMGRDGGGFASAALQHHVVAQLERTPDGGQRAMRPLLDVNIGDVDGDGDDDVVTTGEYGEPLRVLRSAGDGGLSQSITLDVGHSSLLDATLGDLNADGRADLICFDSGGQEQLLALTSAADGGLEQSFAHDAGRYSGSAAIADFDGDGVVDLLVTRLPDITFWHDVEFHRGYGNGAFVSTPVITRERIDVGLESSAADLNGDGRPDVVFSGARSWDDFYDSNGTYHSELSFGYDSVQALLYVDGGYFDPDERTFYAGWAGQIGIGDPVVGELNRNSTPDVAAVSPVNGVAVWVDQKGPPRWTPVVGFPIALEGSDLNRDGVLDLVTANRQSTDVSILLGRCE